MGLELLRRQWSTLTWLWLLLSLGRWAFAASETQLIAATTEDGRRVMLADNRKPSLYTGDFGDCLGSSSVNVSRFDAAYYKDNMTVTFHLQGNTALNNESLMMYIGVYAYGESRFDLTFNPCDANIASMCPMKSDVPIEANGIIPIAPKDVAGITPIALAIPDFEGEAILRIFSNSSESEIGCFSAIVTNGGTFSHPKIIGSILAVFAAISIIASFATSIYGDDVLSMRKHYAHSLSVLVVFAVFHHIYFTGALSMNWPSVLVAFWSNFGWAGGMIYSEGMQNSINQFIRSNNGNVSVVGAASSLDEEIGGSYDLSTIYRRSLDISNLVRRDSGSQALRALAKRSLTNSTDGFVWYGDPVRPGLPLPGNFSGFAGTLARERIPGSNAFMTGFIWFLVATAILAVLIFTLKWGLEGLCRVRLIKNDRLTYFRSHWMRYTGLALLRTCFIAFFMMTTLTLYQFNSKGAAGVTALAAIVFAAFLIGMFGLAGCAYMYRIRVGKYARSPDRINLEKRTVLKLIPWYSFSRASKDGPSPEKVYAGSIPFWNLRPSNGEAATSVHEDEEFTKKFGWLAARFRRTRWWFFGPWLLYELIRACFFGGASGNPVGQVFGLLIVEFIAFIVIIVMRPFEGQRLNALMVYLLGFSKVSTVALSAACDVRFNIARISTTVVGVVIIVIQGVLTIVLMAAIVVGACSSYMSVTRNRSEEDFRPRRWGSIRERYLKHVDRAASDLPHTSPAQEENQDEQPKKPNFSVSSVRRVAKIEDEDGEFMAEINGLSVGTPDRSSVAGTAGPSHDDNNNNNNNNNTRARAASVYSQTSQANVPFGARVHRASWSSRDLQEWADREGGGGQRRSVATALVSTERVGSRPTSGVEQLPYSPRAATPRAGPSRQRTKSEAMRAVSPLPRSRSARDLNVVSPVMEDGPQT